MYLIWRITLNCEIYPVSFSLNFWSMRVETRDQLRFFLKVLVFKSISIFNFIGRDIPGENNFHMQAYFKWINGWQLWPNLNNLTWFDPIHLTRSLLFFEKVIELYRTEKDNLFRIFGPQPIILPEIERSDAKVNLKKRWTHQTCWNVKAVMEYKKNVKADVLPSK